MSAGPQVPPGGRVAVRVPATSANLGPGFDAMGVALSLHLTAAAVDRPEGDDRRVVTTGEGSDELPGDDTNLVWRTFVRGCEAWGVEVPDVQLRVANPIPLERGLGSSSAAIVAGLGLARALAPEAVGDLDVLRLADEVEGHPDNVAPAIIGGFVLAVPDDDGELVVRTSAPPARLRPVVLVPTSRQNTDEARGVVPDALAKGDVAVHGARASFVAGAMAGAWPPDARVAGDRLHEPARLGVMAASGAVVADLRGAGLHAWLSGAGPTVAAMVEANADAGVTATIDEVAGRHGFVVHHLDWDLAGLVDCGAERCGVSGMRGCAGCPWG